PDRACADAIFYVPRTGCQGQALDQTELCAHSMAHDRFQAWVEADVFLALWQAGVQQFDEGCGIEWEWLASDGAPTTAALGGRKNGAPSHQPGQVRRQTLPADRGAWGPDRLGGGWGESACEEIGASHPPESGGLAARADHGAATRDVFGCGL